MTITLTGSDLVVELAPQRGADIRQVTDRRTGTPVLAVSPTGRARPTHADTDSMVAWLRGYPGGWQLLVPNAGPERDHDGVRQGYHGEAALTEWEVLDVGETGCELATHLATAPLRLHREVSLEGPALVVRDTVVNLSPDEVWTRIVQHPAFGAPFLDDRSYVVTNARELVSDAEAPGSLVGPDAVGPPGALLPVGPRATSIALPGPGAQESLFAALTDFDGPPSATFVSPSRGFAMRLEWDAVVLPHAWFWIEANASSGWPWFRRLYAVAIEPANVLPGDGAAGRHRRGGPGVRIGPREHLTMTTRLSRQSLPGTDR